MRDFTRFFLRNRALSWLLLGLVLAGGLFAYLNMGKLEDAPFTIKQALVTTSYPGASPMEVREQVTDILEEAIQSLGELYYLKSDNRAGLSKITVYVKKEIRAEDMQQLWDKLRRKVGDAQSKLPAGAGPSVVNDDFGDVLGVFYSLSSPTRTYREMEDQAKALKNDLLGIQDVAKVELFGLQNRTIEGTVNPALLSRSGVTLTDIASAFERQNRIVDAGAIETSTNRLRVEAAGSFGSLEEIENLTVISRAGDYFRLGDLARIEESYARPPRSRMTVGGQPAVGIAISTVADGNVVEMARRVADYIDQAREGMPEGYNLDIIYDQGHESAVAAAIRWRYVILSGMVVALLVAGWGFRFIPRQFMPLLNKQYFSIDMWLPEGTRFEECERQAAELTDLLREYEGVKKVSTFVGQTPPRYYLANAAYGPQPNYAQFLVETETPERSAELRTILYDQLPERFPNALVRVNSFEINSIPQALIEARFCGDDPRVLDSLTNEAIRIMRRNPKVLNARNEWGNQAMMIKIGYDPIKAGRLNIGREEMTRAVKSVNDGTTIGLYRDNDKKVPVLIRADEPGDWNMDRLADLSVWNGSQSSPLAQVAKEISLDWEYPLVRTYDRQLSMAAQCDVKRGHTMEEVHSEIREEIERMRLPEGYTFFWDSQYKDQKEAMAALTKYFPLAFILLVVILVALFGNFRQPLIILLILPLSLIGMVFGLWLTGFQFGFFCIAGWLGLLGMIIKNVIVLLDEINVQRRSGRDPYTAVIEATVSRTRPVLMAALTTVFGSIPLLFDIVFGGMAATIVFGLSFATLLTLFVTPALYTILYGVGKRAETSSNLSK